MTHLYIFLFFIFIAGATYGQIYSSIPNNAQIVFACDTANEYYRYSGDSVKSNELYVMDTLGTPSSVTRITYDNYLYFHFAVSPDRKKIAAVRVLNDTDPPSGLLNPVDQKSIWILDLVSKASWTVDLGLDAGWGGVDWDPDNNHIYAAIDSAGVFNIYKININDTTFTNVTSGIDGALGLSMGKVVTDVSVSNDGEWIAFATKKIIPTGLEKKSRIAVCKTNGDSAKWVTSGGNLFGDTQVPTGCRVYSYGDYDPEFSPDGNWIVSMRFTDVDTNWCLPTSTIIKMKCDGTDSTLFTMPDSTASYGLPDWNYSGTKIVMSEWNENQVYIGTAVMNADGTQYTRLTTLPATSMISNTYARFMAPVYPLSIDELTTEKIKIFPNPATDFVEISLDYDLKGESQVVFISEAGYIYHKESIGNISKNEKYNIDISKIPAGKYLVTIVNGKTYTTPQKLIIL